MIRMSTKRWMRVVWAGMAIVALVAGMTAGIAAKHKSYTVKQLTAHWSAPYDLVVFPRGHTLPTASSFLNPNSLDTGQGGISLAQYHRVAHIRGVAVAAPLAPIGYLPLNFGFVNVFGSSAANAPGGVYRLTLQHDNEGLPAGSPQTLYADNDGSPGAGGLAQLPMGTLVFVMAVNPTAERQLMGLKQAVATGHYFTEADNQVKTSAAPKNQAFSAPMPRSPVVHLPVLLTRTPPAAGTLRLTVQRLRIPSRLQATVPNLVAQFQRTGHAGALRPLTGTTVVNKKIPNGTLWDDGLATLEGRSVTQIAGLPLTISYQGTLQGAVFDEAGTARVHRVHSPVSMRWPIALTVVPQPQMTSVWGVFGEPFRTVTLSHHVNLRLTPIGTYNPARLRVTDDPLTHLPLVGYRPESGRLVLNSQGHAVNPPGVVLPDGSPAGLWTAPPEAITTLGAAKPLLGKTPISSIRIRVSDVPAIGAGGARRLAQVAHAITRATGLPVQVVRGASPEQVLLHPEALAGFGRPGWIETDWVRLGASTEILRQALLNQAVMLGPVMAAAAIFAGVTAWLGLAASSRKWAVAAAVGVAPKHILRQLMGGAALQGGAVAVIAVLTALIVGGMSALVLGVPIGAAAGLLVTLAMVPSAWKAAVQDPVQGLRPLPPHGVVKMRLVDATSLSVAMAGGAWPRLLLASAALVIPAATAYAVVLMQGVWHGTLHVTVLGEYLLLKGGWLMTFGLILTLILAAATAAVIALANSEARRKTWAIGMAVGWQPKTPWAASTMEIGMVGAVAGAIGAAIAGGVLQSLLGVPLLGWLWFVTVLGITGVSVLASLPGAWAISRRDPVSVLRGDEG